MHTSGCRKQPLWEEIMKIHLRIYLNSEHAYFELKKNAYRLDSKVSISGSYIEFENNRIYYKCAQSINSRFYQGIRFHSICGDAYINDIQIRQELLRRKYV